MPVPKFASPVFKRFADAMLRLQTKHPKLFDMLEGAITAMALDARKSPAVESDRWRETTLAALRPIDFRRAVVMQRDVLRNAGRAEVARALSRARLTKAEHAEYLAMRGGVS